MVVSKELAAFDDRIASFRAHRVGNGAKRGGVKAWPHTRPSVTQMAKAGFIYNPSPQSPDNVTCFLCDKSLDGWNKGDDPKIEHLDHSPLCAWAIIQGSDWKDDEYHDPESSDMLRARFETFGTWWPHDGKRGWIPTSSNMSRAGFFYNPGRSGDDFAACMYCGVVLDGWEPKDDPTEEHRRRGPDCYFFTRIHRGSSKGKRNSKARQSTSAVSKKTNPRKRLSSGMAVDEEVDVEEPKPKRRANKRNSKASRSSTAEDTSRDVDESNASQTSQQRRLSARLATSREITLSSVHTDSIAEGEQEPEIAVKRTRGPRPMKTKTAKTKQPLQSASPRVEIVPPVPPLPQIVVKNGSAASSGSNNSSGHLEDLIANYSESYEEALEPATANVKPSDVSEFALPPSTPGTEMDPDQAPRSLARPASSKATPKTHMAASPVVLASSQKTARMVNHISTTVARNSPAQSVREPLNIFMQDGSPIGEGRTSGKDTPVRGTRSRNEDTNVISIAQTSPNKESSTSNLIDGQLPPIGACPIGRGAVASSPREKFASRADNLNSSPRILTDSPHNGNVALISRDVPCNKLQWLRKSLSRYVDEHSDANPSVVGEADLISDMDLGMTVEECIRRLAEVGERTLLTKCDKLVEFLERESERAIKLLESSCS
ncbi:uncharacterized protein V1513DRAFT_464344 [Lipomyces chichibuensis]|uniref:uncharacterized protein n=1 Tax=Lipomyces chichibuensis TaxID=1546026 RepID=UPI003343020C